LTTGSSLFGEPVEHEVAADEAGAAGDSSGVSAGRKTSSSCWAK
jgi:hypothetical protein